jgi:hypothetical protein
MLKPIVRVVVAALLCSSLWVVDLEAGWRARHCQRCNISCGTPCCAESGTPYWAERVVNCTGLTCWCCMNGEWVVCAGPCDACTSSPSQPPSASCGGFGGCASDCCDGRLTLLFRMICDCRTHRLRFALPCEQSAEWYRLRWLGAPCNTLSHP